MAEHIGERSEYDVSQIFVEKSLTGFQPVKRVCHLIAAISGFTSLGSGYLSNTSATVCRFATPLSDSAFFPCLPLRQPDALCAYQHGQA